MNKRLKKLRLSLELTQQEFADSIRVKRNTVATYERGRSEPSDAAISLICKTFNVNETWLRTGSGDMFLPKNRNQEISEFFDSLSDTDSFKSKLVSALASLSEDQWESLAEIASKLVANSVTVGQAEAIYKNSGSSGASDTDASALNTTSVGKKGA